VEEFSSIALVRTMKEAYLLVKYDKASSFGMVHVVFERIAQLQRRYECPLPCVAQVAFVA